VAETTLNLRLNVFRILHKITKNNNRKVIFMNIKPLGNRVIIQRLEEECIKGIIIPDSAKKKKDMAKVIAIGNLKDTDIKVDDTVLIEKYAGTEFSVSDEQIYLIVKVEDIIAVLE
jgi:chaperonin GroES